MLHSDPLCWLACHPLNSYHRPMGFHGLHFREGPLPRALQRCTQQPWQLGPENHKPEGKDSSSLMMAVPLLAWCCPGAREQCPFQPCPRPAGESLRLRERARLPEAMSIPGAKRGWGTPMASLVPSGCAPRDSYFANTRISRQPKPEVHPKQNKLMKACLLCMAHKPSLQAFW